MASGIEFPPETRAQFLAALAITGSVTQAAERAQVAVPTLYAWRNKDEAFRTAWNETKAMRRDIRADKAWVVVEDILKDDTHKDRLAAAKLAIEHNDAAQQQRGGADADGIAEAIDRFTSAVVGLAQRQPVGDVPQLDRGRAGLASLYPDREGKG